MKRIQGAIALWILSLLSGILSGQTNNAIFDGGLGDGFDWAGFEQPTSNLIFAGGPGDGYASDSLIQEVNNFIFAGGSGDGYNVASFQQKTSNAIFAGGFGDGYDQNTTIASASPYDLYILGLGIFGTDADELNDFDSDGHANIVEFALGSLANSASSLPELRASQSPQDGFTLTYLRRAGGKQQLPQTYLADDILYNGESSLDLVTWEDFAIDISNPSGLPAPPAGYE
ncbi:MAG: hypothetical protein AAGC74_02565 [Verrucomicrobiota bacterium]